VKINYTIYFARDINLYVMFIGLVVMRSNTKRMHQIQPIRNRVIYLIFNLIRQNIHIIQLHA